MCFLGFEQLSVHIHSLILNLNLYQGQIKEHLT